MKEFYFVRHGETDYNRLRPRDEPPHDTPLNATGRAQAAAIEPVIAALPIQTICYSPIKRAQETKNIIAAGLQIPQHEVGDLSECSMTIWNEMARHGMYSPPPITGAARLFIDRIQNGMNQALSLPSPALIVAHGGVHWAICCLLGIENHGWAIRNCEVVHFSIRSDGKWTASKLYESPVIS